MYLPKEFDIFILYIRYYIREVIILTRKATVVYLLKNGGSCPFLKMFNLILKIIVNIKMIRQRNIHQNQEGSNT